VWLCKCVFNAPLQELVAKMPVTFCQSLSLSLYLHVESVLPSDGFLCDIYVGIVFNLCVKGECEVARVHTMNPYGGSGGIAPLILKPVTRWS
jgi:hypothetical protein